MVMSGAQKPVEVEDPLDLPVDGRLLGSQTTVTPTTVTRVPVPRLAAVLQSLDGEREECLVATMVAVVAILARTGEVAVAVRTPDGRAHAVRAEITASTTLLDLLAQVALHRPPSAALQVMIALDDDTLPEGIELLLTVTADEVTLLAPAPLFEQESLEAIGVLLATFLAVARTDVHRPLQSLSLVTPEELETATDLWNATTRPLVASSVLALVRLAAAAGPDRVAVRDDLGQLSYRELVARVVHLADTLAARGAGPGTRVAVCVERSAILPLALLAVLSTGAAYVPVDPAYPPDRTAHMLSDSGTVLVIATPAARQALAAAVPPGCAVIDVPLDARALPEYPGELPDGVAEEPAYVLYTSGSTGMPKGVVVPHRALANFLLSMQRTPGFGLNDVLLAVTTLSFDIAGLELFLPLVTGGSVAVASQPTTVDPVALTAALARHGATILQATPATFRMLVDSGWAGQADLRALCGGEALPRALAAELVPRVAELWNMYGPTETTIWSTVARIHDPAAPVTLGMPIDNTDVHVVGPDGGVLPVGVPGELVIGGLGLALGYWKRPKLTAERFVPHPVTPDALVYRTGDLVRRRSDGTLVFQGRLDHQVKVRGFRIELGEVEAALGRHPAVIEVVATAPEVDGQTMLVAHVALRSAASAEQLRRSVTDVLPAYMVPNAVVVLPALPRTPNGKVDRRSLPAVTAADVALDGERVAPRDVLEARLVALWQEVLDLDGLGVTDDFFTLGVDSLRAARLFARVEQDLSTKLPLAPVFAAPTVEKLADMIRAGTIRDRHLSLVPIQTGGTRLPFFGVHGGAGTVLLYAELARRLGSDQPFYGLQAVGLYGDAAPQRSVAEMASTYLAEMRAVQPSGPYRLGGYCFGALVAWEMATRLRDAGERVAMVATFNGPAPGYLRRFKAVFDDEGALFDEQGQLVERAVGTRPRSAATGLRDALRGPGAVHELAGGVRRRARRILLPRIRNAQLAWSLGLRRPLPVALREGHWFGLLAARAQDEFVPRSADVPVVVFRAAGLYHEDALGWDEVTTAGVQAFEVPGEGQTVPRRSMREPYVGYVADRLVQAMADGSA